MVLRVLTAGVIAVAVLAAPVRPADAERLRLEQTEPDHQRGLPRPIEVPEPKTNRLHYISPQVVYRLPSDVPEVAKFDPVLSRLCRKGAFTQATPGFYWARTPVRSYGVAFSGGANLNDPQNKRKPRTVYFFDDAENRCAVFTADQAKLMTSYVGP